MNILCNIADWNKENMYLLARTINPRANINFTSSFRKLDQMGIIDNFYSIMSLNKKFNKLSKEDEEIISRCRILRILKKNESLLIVNSMRESIKKELKLNSINMVITELIDQYFHDILVREAKKLNIIVFAPIQTFVNGYSRLTLFGENQIFRTPSETEVNDVCQKLESQSYEPNYISNLKVTNSTQHVIRVLKN